MAKLITFLILVPFTLAFPRTLLVPEDFLTIQQAVVMAQNGDTVSVNFGRPNGQRSLVATERIFGKTITFEVRGEGNDELLEMIQGLDNFPNPNQQDHQTSPLGWQGQKQVNEPDELYDACWGYQSIIFDNQNRPWVFWGGRPTTNGNMWAYYTYWDSIGWVGDKVAIALPGPERWDAYAHRATLGLDNQPYLACHIVDPYNLRDIYYTHYNGSEWTPKIMVNLPDSTENDYQPHIDANGGRMWVTWFGGPTDFFYKIYVSHWDGNGWTPEEVISSANYHNWFQNVAVDRNGNPHIAWIALDLTPNRQDVLFYRYYNGNRWLEPETVMKGMLLYAGIHWSGLDLELDEEENPHITFDAMDTTNSQRFQIYYTKKQNGKWIKPILVTNNEYDEGGPLLAVLNSHNIWITWTRNNNHDIVATYYNGQDFAPEIIVESNLSYFDNAQDLKFDPQGRLWLIHNGVPYGRNDEEVYYNIYGSSYLEEVTQNRKYQVKTITPNPFSHHTTISYELTKPTSVKIEVFDKLGKRINLLETGFKYPGSYTINWEGKDQDDKVLPNGIYFISLTLDNKKETMPVILLR
jgi:hypothetical protein